MTLGRRELLALMAAMPALACGGRSAPAVAPGPTLKLDPLVDLVPSPGLVWLVEARPVDLLSGPGIAPGVAIVVPPERFERFAGRNAGIDPRRLESLVVASYAATTLTLARGTPVQPASVEEAFSRRVAAVEGRSVEGGVTRLWGSVGPDREQIALFGADAVGLEHGRLGPLQPAVYFAQGKLRRARPALRAEPLSTAAELVGPAPLRFFAPGPFEGDWSGGLGGLLRATTALAITAHPVRPPGKALEIQLALTGAWGTDAPAAAERLVAALQLLSNDSLGRLMGLDHPVEGPRVSADAQALRLQIALDPLALASGLHAATDARIDEIMKY